MATETVVLFAVAALVLGVAGMFRRRQGYFSCGICQRCGAYRTGGRKPELNLHPDDGEWVCWSCLTREGHQVKR